MFYNSRSDVGRLLAEQCDTKCNLKLGGFRSQLQASYVSGHTEELWYNKTVCRWMTIYIYIYIVSSGLIVVEGDPKTPFSIATIPRCRERHYSFPWITSLTLDPYDIMLSVKTEGIKDNFFCLWYDSTWDCTSVSHTVKKQLSQNFLALISTKKINKIYFLCFVFLNFWKYFFNDYEYNPQSKLYLSTLKISFRRLIKKPICSNTYDKHYIYIYIYTYLLILTH